MHSNLYSKVYSGAISFLISERKARDKLNAMKIAKKMSPEQKVQRLMPHELTSILFKEILNLKIRPAGANNQIAVECINTRMGKDKFSALEMGVYQMYLDEEEHLSHRRNRGLSRKLFFYTGGGN